MNSKEFYTFWLPRPTHLEEQQKQALGGMHRKRKLVFISASPRILGFSDPILNPLPEHILRRNNHNSLKSPALVTDGLSLWVGCGLRAPFLKLFLQRYASPRCEGTAGCRATTVSVWQRGCLRPGKFPTILECFRVDHKSAVLGL